MRLALHPFPFKPPRSDAAFVFYNQVEKLALFGVLMLKTILRSTWIYCLLNCLLLSTAHAEKASHEDEMLLANPQLSLHSVLEKTITRYPDSQMLEAKQLEIEARSKHAKGLLPHAPAIGLFSQNDSMMSGRGEKGWEAELELPIWLPGQRAAREAIAKDAALGFTDLRDNLALQVAGLLRNALWDISMVSSQAKLAKSRYETAQALVHDVEKRFKAGDLAKTDVMLAQNEAYQAETFKLRADAEVKHAEFRYQLLTGLNQLPADYSEKESSSTLNESHPSLRDAAKKLLLADDERNLVRAERRENPSIAINTRSQRGAFDNQSNESIGLRVRIPFETESKSAPLIANAEMNYARNQVESSRLRYTLEAAYHEAEHNLEVTRAELIITEKQQANAQENLRLAKKAFALGESDLVNLLRVQASAYEAERALQQRQIQLQWDIAQYNQAVGELP